MATANVPLSATSGDEPSLNEAAGTRCPACGGALGPPTIHGRDRLYGLPGNFSVALCDNCEMGVTVPMVDASELHTFYPTTYGAYESSLTGVLGLASKVMQRLLAWNALSSDPLKRLNMPQNGRILDVGCGGGELGSWLVRRGWKVVGIEPSEDACVVARARGLDARAGMVAEVPLEPQTYDAAVFQHSLEHVADPVADLRLVRAALRNGGMVIVTVPNFGCWQRRHFGQRWFNLDLPRHRFHFNSQALTATLEQAGFTEVETLTTSSAVGLLASVQYAIFDRCLFPSGLPLRLAIAACFVASPISRVLNHIGGGGDALHAIAYAR